jgi:hypothetical protein
MEVKVHGERRCGRRRRRVLLMDGRRGNEEGWRKRGVRRRGIA